MIAGGIVVGVIGAVLWFVGVQINADHSTQNWAASWSASVSRDATGDILIFIGVAFVIIGIIILIAGLVREYGVNTKVESNNADTAEDGEDSDLYCPICGNDIAFGDMTCSSCRNPINWKDVVENKKRTEGVVETEKEYCTNCGAEITGAGKFCAKCGMKVE
ncbi:MAG: zinc ribbon domain-containing protein [Ruminococcus sp.]|nr:zinc ribbon domain-containing protein [Ruminococcus sp.]